MAEDWFDEQLRSFEGSGSEFQQAAQQESGGFQDPYRYQTSGGFAGPMPTGGTQDAEALTRQYYASNPYGGSIQGLYDFLKQNGVAVDYVDHRGQPSADKLWINGRMVDVVGSSDSPDAHWAYTDVTDQHYAAQNGGTPTGASGTFGSLSQGWTTPFQSDYKTFTRPSPEDIANDPSFKFQFEQGIGALQRSAAAKGTLLTGGTMKDLEAFGQGLASTFDDKYYNRALGENQMGYSRDLGEYGINRENFYTNQDNLFNRNYSLAQLGQQAAGQLGQYGSSYSGLGAGLMTGAGNAQAAGTVGSANAYTPLYGTAADLFNQWWQSRNSSQPVLY